MDGIYVLTAANVLRLEENPFEILFLAFVFSHLVPSLYRLLTCISCTPFSVRPGI